MARTSSANAIRAFAGKGNLMAIAPARPRAGQKATARTSDRRKRAAKLAQPNRPFARAQRKFLRAFPGGFRDETYLDWERDYKWRAHLRWQDDLSEASLRK